MKIPRDLDGNQLIKYLKNMVIQLPANQVATYG